MTPEDRDVMIELSKRIVRETDIKKLVSWIDELKELISEQNQGTPRFTNALLRRLN